MKNMKKIATLFLALILILTIFTGCKKKKASPAESGSNLQISIYNKAVSSENITVSFAENHITTATTEITVNLKNKSNFDFTYGNGPTLEQKINGVWRRVPILKNISYETAKYLLPKNGTSSFVVNVKKDYGTLYIGHFRILKPLSRGKTVVIVAKEFDI